MKELAIVNAYENNLKNISVVINPNCITVINGVNGSGKSTLAKSVVFGEYSRQERLKNKITEYDLFVRPKFDSILNPYKSIYIGQKSPKQTENSSVATISGISNLLKKELINYGDIWCSDCSLKVSEVASIDIVKVLSEQLEEVELRYNLIRNEYPNAVYLRDKLKKLNSNRINVSDQNSIRDADYIKKLNPDNRMTIDCIVDFNLLSSDDLIDVKRLKLYSKGKLKYDFSKQTFCACLKEYYTKRPALFTTSNLGDFNGSCYECEGKGFVTRVDFESLINKNPVSLKFLNIPHNGSAYKYCYIQDSDIKKIVKSFGSSLDIGFDGLGKVLQDEIKKYIEPKILSKADNNNISNYVKKMTCSHCDGTGFNYQSRAVKYKDMSFSDMLVMDVDTLSKKFQSDRLDSINEKFKLLGLPNFDLIRSSITLSGGELQRLKLIKYLEDSIEDVLIIIDEPSKGLSVEDISNLFVFLRELSKNNTVLLIDHSEYVINNSDYSLTLGPNSGVNGGYICEMLPSSVSFPMPDSQKDNEIYTYNRVSNNYVIDQDVSIMLNGLNAIFGISGSGKSSLANGIFNLILPGDKHFQHKAILKQTEIIGNIRSTVLSYLKISDSLRSIFSDQPISKALNLNKEHFSSNTEEGMCRACNGTGIVESGVCQSCLGTKLIPLANFVYYGDNSISDYLSMTIRELKDSDIYVDFKGIIELLISLGLGHLSLGRTTSTLSGGESQRLKMAKYLNEMANVINSKSDHVLMLLDEPMRGLSDEDSLNIFFKLKSLTLLNNTIIIIEHNPKVVMGCDYLIEVGPKSGKLGGKIIFNDYSNLYVKNIKNDNKNKSVTIVKNSYFKEWCFTEEDLAFNRQKEFKDGFEINSVTNTKIFRDKKSLVDSIKLSSEDLYYFNPLYYSLLKSSSISHSHLKSISSNLIDLGFETCLVDGLSISLKELPEVLSCKNFWEVMLSTKSLDLALDLGAGVVALKKDDDLYMYSLRVIDTSNKVIGSRLDKLNNDFFNLFYHKCPQCSGTGEVEVIENLDFDITKSFLDIACYPDFLKNDMKKVFFRLNESLIKFTSERIFNSNIPVVELSYEDNKNILFGVYGLSFLKENGRKGAKEDMIEWEGIYKFIINRSSKFSLKNRSFIENNTTIIRCPSCNGSKYKDEFNYYTMKGKKIWE